MSDTPSTIQAAGLLGRSHARVRWGWAEAIGALAAIVAFVNILPNDFAHDGKPIVRDNLRVNAPDQWTAIWTTDYWSETALENPTRDLLYRPVALTSYRCVRAVFGSSALSQHAVNLILYALLCALIARLARRIGGSTTAATVAATVFAVLPIHTEVLGDVVGRGDLLVAVGIVLVLLLHRRSMVAGSTASVTGLRVAAAIVAFCAMGSKESAVSLVVIVPLFDWLWSTGSKPAAGRTLRTVFAVAVRTCYLILPAVIYLGLRMNALGGVLHQQPNITKTINVLADAPAWQHALGVVQLWGMYWAKTLWPGVLSISYTINAIRLATGPFDRHVLLGAITAVGLVAISVIQWRRGRPVFAVLTAALLITYAPTANALVLIQVFFAERIWFLPSVWIALGAGLLAARIAPRPASYAAFAVVIAAMALRCWDRNVEWRSDGTLYAAAYRDQPTAVGARYLFGQWLIGHADFDHGVVLLNSAIEIDPGYTDAHRTLGHAYLREGRLVEAVEHLRIAAMQVSGDPATDTALAEASKELAKSDTQLASLRRAADDDPNDLEAELALIRRLRDLGMIQRALDRFRQARERFSSAARWHAEYAVTLVYANERDQAVAQYEWSLEIAPNNAQGTIELAMLLLERRATGDGDRAWTLAGRARKQAPNAPAVLMCVAEVSAFRGDIAGAIAAYQQAIDALPPGSPQRRLFEERAKTLGR